ncbi:MAG: hypothetical protein AD742_08465 [Methylibium sp. NZG]|nr:MAG: hypothetical protein AD742_08465 [Methylibium sp. NZG]
MRAAVVLALAAGGSLGVAAPPFDIAQYPLFLSPSIKPNLMIIFDNSQSMDATMGGKVISGDDPTTRANIARGVLRGVIDTNRFAFNWGLTTFGIRDDRNTLFNTQAYYLGNASTMVYTNDCVNGVSTSTAGLRCVELPAALVNGNGFRFVTFERSGDDADVNDVFYSGFDLKPWGVGLSGTSFNLWGQRDNGTGWLDANFSNPLPINPLRFTPTDAGFTPNGDTFKRALFLTRGWGYYGDITGAGNIVQPVQDDSAAHFTRLQTLLGNETNTNTPEIKNSAVFTPLAGSLRTVRDYFRQGESAARKSPVSQTCQSNFVVLATDGNPTGTTSGTQYDPSQWVNTQDPLTGLWTWGQAQQDVFAQITALRSTTLTGANLTNPALANQTFDIKTYVLGMGDTVANASSVAALNEMARLGNAYPTAFLGNSAASIQSAFQTIVGDVLAKTSAGAAVAVNSGAWATGASVYQAKFNSTDWSGNLAAFPVSASGAIGRTPTWEAAAQVKAQNWDTGRNILTYKPSVALGTRGIRFRWPTDPTTPTAVELDTAQSAPLNADGFGAARLAWLRGDDSREARRCATPPCAAPQFRSRPVTPLGDIINSAPNYVAAPAFGYFDDFEAQPYSAFVAARRNRTPTIYVGANDGMLHAFNANTGNELFAYVPAALYETLPQLSSQAYAHRFYADGSPTVGDVFYDGAWRTLLVAGMRAGAKGIYALDVTDPADFNEANANRVVRWEFQDPDLGYVFSQPLIVKTNNGRWSVIVAGGYNAGNASGRAMLFVLDAETGALLTKIDAPSGTALAPNGLSSPAAIDSSGDGIVDLVYAGDLNGNLWKFDLTAATTNTWGLGNGGAALFTTPGGQPITGRPDVTRFPRGGGFLVGFGTGRYLAPGDQGDTSAQSVYAIRDSGVDGTVLLTDLQQQSILGTKTNGGVEYRLSTHAVDQPLDTLIANEVKISRPEYLSTKKGWYLNLPASGERVVADARFRAGRLIFTSMIPDTSAACSFGGTGWLLEFDAITGNRLDSATFDTNNDRVVDVADNLQFTQSGTGFNNTSGRRLNAISAAPGFMASGKLDLRLLNQADGTVETVVGSLGTTAPARAMWREVR